MMIIAAHLLGAFLNWAIQKKKDKEEPGEEKEDKNNEVTKKQKVILLWDSHMEALVLPELEKIAHFDLVAPGALRAKNITTMGGHSQRAYNSVFNWPGARFPRGCQEYRVAEMLSIGSYDGIHMRGLPARKLYTMSVYEALMSIKVPEFCRSDFGYLWLFLSDPCRGSDLETAFYVLLLLLFLLLLFHL